MRYLIWSLEHNAWWRMGSMGYTVNREEAGEYSQEEALRICTEANLYTGEKPNEAMVPIVEGSAS